MARLARLMLEGWPLHITHRGNHRQAVFVADQDRRDYLALLRRFAEQFEMAIWAYCLMPNHVHLIAVGGQRRSIARAVGNTHREFSRRAHENRSVTGHLWANRYFSTLLDETHLWAAVRYVELNPVRAGLVDRATDYPWSSAAANAGKTANGLLDPARPFPGPIADWASWLGIGVEESTVRQLRRNTLTGQPTCGDLLLPEIEERLRRPVRPKKVRPPRAGPRP